MNLPKTVLSFLYHGTIPPFQEEMHADFNTAFDRFNVTSTSLRQACLNADDAAFRLRTDPTSTQAQADLAAASRMIFDNLAPAMALEVAQGITAPDQPINGSELGNDPTRGLMPDLYRLVYSSAFRATDPGAPNSNVQAEWEAFKSALIAGSGAFASLLGDATTLCNQMNADATQGTWTMWW